MKITPATIKRFFTALYHAGIYICEGRPVIAPKQIVDAREGTCLKCKYNDFNTCRICSCYIAAKIRLSSEECPDKPPRWSKL